MNSSRVDQFQEDNQFTEGSFTPYVQQFRGHLEQQHYRAATISEYLLCINRFSQLLRNRSIGIRSFDEDQIPELLQDIQMPGLRRKSPVFIIRSFVRFLSEIGVRKPLPPAAPDNSVRGRSGWNGRIIFAGNAV